MIGCLPTQALAFLAVFVYATHATQATAFKWKPGLRLCNFYELVLLLDIEIQYIGLLSGEWVNFFQGCVLR